MLLLSKLLVATALVAGAGTGAVTPMVEELAECTPAGSSDYLQVCNRFTTEPGTIRCIAAGRDRFFSSCALSLCLRFTTEEGSIKCLEASRDKAYTTDEAALCNRFTTEDGAVGCLAAAGRRELPRDGDDVRFLRRVRADLMDAADDIRTGRTRRGLDLIDDVIRQIDIRVRD